MTAIIGLREPPGHRNMTRPHGRGSHGEGCYGGEGSLISARTPPYAWDGDGRRGDADRALVVGQRHALCSLTIQSRQSGVAPGRATTPRACSRSAFEPPRAGEGVMGVREVPPTSTPPESLFCPVRPT